MGKNIYFHLIFATFAGFFISWSSCSAKFRYDYSIGNITFNSSSPIFVFPQHPIKHTSTSTPITIGTILETQIPPLGPFDRTRGPDCKTPFVTFDLKPICGTDGSTYDNVSIFRNAQCDNEKLEFLHWGRCSGSYTAIKGRQQFIYKRPYLPKGVLPPVITTTTTNPPPTTTTTITTTNTTTTTSTTTKPTIEYHEPSPLGPFDRVRGPDCKTPFVTADYRPICGTDGNTYSNVSLFRNAQCDDPNLEFKHWGECTLEEAKPEEPQESQERPPLGPFDRIRGPDCKTPFVTLEFDPICGTDGNTYDNISLFRNAQCDDVKLLFKHWGECTAEEAKPEEPQKPQEPQERSPLGPFDRIRGPGCRTPCTREYNPVCGTDGKTYPNPCEFRNAQCDNVNLNFKHWGPCTQEEAKPEKPQEPQERPPLGPFDRIRGPDCKTPFVTYELNPICGSNGKTYPNVSTFRNAQCDNTNLEFKHWGECTPEEIPVKEKTKRKPLGSLKRPRGPECKESCPKFYDPVCSSTGTVYANECYFRNAQCDDEKLKFLHWGPCDSGDADKINGIIFTNESGPFNLKPLGPFDRVRGPDCKTSFVDFNYYPICGSDGKTYNNVSEFRNAQCDDANLKFIYWGACFEGYQKYFGTMIPLGPFDRIRGPDCKTPCTREYNPVCGTDGETYSNPCEFRNAQCDNVNLNFKHWGLCEKRVCNKPIQPRVVVGETLVKEPKQPALGPFDRVRGPDCRTPCTREYNPVCGTDGKTYPNPCEFRNAQCDDESLEFVHFGECDLNSNVEQPLSPVGEVNSEFYRYNYDLYRIRGDNCKKPCSNLDSPVYGSDGKEYKNICYLLNEMCDDHTLEHYMARVFDSKEEMNNPPKIVKPDLGAFDRKRGPDCKQECNKYYNPVCSSTGAVYANECYFRNAQCEDEKLTFLHWGPCNSGDADKIMAIIYTKDSGPFETLPLGPFDRVRGPDCKTPFVTMDLRYICGSDGKTYDNISHFRNAQCDDENLQFVHWGKCMSIKGGIPPYNGFDLKVLPGPLDRERGPDCKTPCTREYNPICGNDGVTYGNLCTFRNAQCDNEGLTALHYGECISEDAPMITTTTTRAPVKVTCSTKPTVSETSRGNLRSLKGDDGDNNATEEEALPTTTTTKTISENSPVSEGGMDKGLFEELMQVISTTSYSTPEPTFTAHSVGNCLNRTDFNILFGEQSSLFQNVVIVCGRSSLGNGNKTAKCIREKFFGPERAQISEQCVSCYKDSATCGSKKCKSACLTSTCNTKCQKCFDSNCAAKLRECVGTSWLPRPCELDPFSPIPEGWKVPDPKANDISSAK